MAKPVAHAHDDAVTAMRAERIGRVVNQEILDPRGRGEMVDVEAVIGRHPDIADELRAHVSVLGMLGGSAAVPDLTISVLKTAGLLTDCDEPGCIARLGAFKIVRKIGQGGMGVVLEGWDAELRRRVAIKVLLPQFASEPRHVARFEREARAAAGLRHENIVTVHSVGRQGGLPYIVMEYVDGPSLAEVLRERGALPAEMCRTVFRQLLEALAAVHGAGLVHRDVKSGNILVEGIGGRDREIEGSRDQEEGTGNGERGTGEEATERRSDEATEGEEGTEARRHAGTEGRDRESERSRDQEEGTGSGERGTEEKDRESERTRDQESGGGGGGAVRVKLVDFGLVRVVDGQTQLTLTDATPGTPAYMSPEQIRGDAEIDHRTDLYSAGVVLYEMLTGRLPFKAETASATIHRILHDEPEDPQAYDASVETGLASLALRLMAKRREDRLSSASATSACLGSRMRVPRLTVLRRRWASALLACCVVSVLVVLGSVLSRSVITAPAVSVVKIDPELPSRVLAQYGRDVTWRVFKQFRLDWEVKLADATTCSVNGGQRMLVAVCSHNPLDRQGSILVGLTPRGREAWRVGLPATFDWPKCAASDEMYGSRILAADLDGVAGEELILIASHPTGDAGCVAIVDPNTGTIRNRFWHPGHYQQVYVQKSFGGPGRPAIIAIATNSLASAYPMQKGEKPLVQWPQVSALMVIDPNLPGGVAPPDMVSNAAATPAGLRAYAILDLPWIAKVPDAVPDLAERSHHEKRDHAAIEWIEFRPLSGIASDRWELSVHVERESGPVILTVDENLDLRRVQVDSQIRPVDKWTSVWRVIVERGG